MDIQTVKLSNKIVEGRYNFSLIEKRIFMAILLELQSKERRLKDPVTKKYVDLELILSRTKIQKDIKDIDSLVKKALVKLMKNTLELKETKDSPWRAINFLSYVSWEKGGNIEVRLTREIVPLLLDLKEQYTILGVVSMMSLKSVWSQRFYAFCCKYRNMGKFNFEFEYLKDLLGVSDKYTLFGAFNNRVLKQAQEEIKKLYDEGISDVYFEYTPDKRGTRAVQNIDFNIIKKHTNIIQRENGDVAIIKGLHTIFKTHNKLKSGLPSANENLVTEALTIILGDPILIDKFHQILNKKAGMDEVEKVKYFRTVIKNEVFKR